MRSVTCHGGGVQVNMVCNYSSPARAACPPSIYLVSGHASCSPAQLPDTVAAKQLAEIHSQGYGETLVPLSWDQVTNTRTCLLIVRNTECGAESEAAKTGEQQPSCRGLVAASLTRTFSVLSLASVVVLLSGSSGEHYTLYIDHISVGRSSPPRPCTDLSLFPQRRWRPRRPWWCRRQSRCRSTTG